MRRTAATSLALAGTVLGALIGAGASAPAAAQGRLEIRARSVLPDAVQEVLHAVAEPTEVTIRGGESVEERMRAHCGGSVSNSYREQARVLNQTAANPSPLASASRIRTMKLPACARVRREGARAYVLPGDGDLDSVLARRLGATVQTPLLICPAGAANAPPPPCQAVTAGDWLVARHRGLVASPLNLPVGREFELPFVSEWVSVSLRAGVAPAEAEARLRAAMRETPVGEALMQIAPAPEIDLPRPIGGEDVARLGGAACSQTEDPPPDWPFDRAAVAAAVRDGRAMLARRAERPGGLPPRGPTVIRIADTGIDRLGEADGLPMQLLATNERALPRPGRGAAPDRYAVPFFGIDPEGKGDVRPRQNDSRGDHGAQVAELALGGRAYWQENADLPHMLRLSFARVFAEERPSGRIRARTEMLNLSLSTRPPDVHIVNFSLGGWEPIRSLEDALTLMRDRRQLAVMAAGNDGAQLDARRYYPVFYRGNGDLAPFIIVAGAHSPIIERDGQPFAEVAGFSNRGAGYVDLLAPGCRLTPPMPTDAGRLISGTSFAAPLVSFTAGMLGALMPDPQPARIRQRIHATVRWVTEEIERSTAFGGVLDIPAALRVFDDVVRLRSGALVVGLWQDEPSIQLCKGEGEGDPSEALAPATLLRVMATHAAAGGAIRLRLLSRNLNDETAAEKSCEALSADGPRLRLEDGSVRSFAWHEVAAFMPAWDLGERRLDGAGPVVGARPVSGARPAAAATMPGDRRMVQAVQQSLTERGFAAGAADGVAGPATVHAIRAFQRSRAEQASGVLTAPQLRALLPTGAP